MKTSFLGSSSDVKPIRAGLGCFLATPRFWRLSSLPLNLFSFGARLGSEGEAAAAAAAARRWWGLRRLWARERVGCVREGRQGNKNRDVARVSLSRIERLPPPRARDRRETAAACNLSAADNQKKGAEDAARSLLRACADKKKSWAQCSLRRTHLERGFQLLESKEGGGAAPLLLSCASSLSPAAAKRRLGRRRRRPRGRAPVFADAATKSASPSSPAASAASHARHNT